MAPRKGLVLLSGVLLLGTGLALYAWNPPSPRTSPSASPQEEFTLASVFGPGMVLQRNMKIPIWGQASPSMEVTLTMAGSSAATRADSEGNWTVRIGPLQAGGPYTLIAKCGSRIVELKDVLVGDVWLASGQSNMDFLLEEAKNAEKEIAAARHPRIRLLRVGKIVGAVPFDYLSGGTWKHCTPETARRFSAVAYFFGRRLHRELGIPIGLIHSAWGGTCIEAWTPLKALKSCPAAKPIFEWWKEIMKTFPERMKRYKRIEALWKVRAALAKKKGNPIPEKPYPPLGPGHDHQPAGLYNAMIHPLVPYGIKGVIWYQGEANVARAHQYKALFPLMIRAWRKAWGEGPFPFFFVQLAGFGIWDCRKWPWLREAQESALSLPHTGMAVAIDIGERANIHPANKQEVGRRLALLALNKVYGRKVPCSGPIYESMKIEGNKIRLFFSHLHGGLVAGGGKNLAGFQVAGPDRVFHQAKASIEGTEVVVWSTHVPRPVAVRYGWAGFPECNLYNKAGLPSPPFRTDTWPPPPDEPCFYPLKYTAPPRHPVTAIPAAAHKCPVSGK